MKIIYNITTFIENLNKKDFDKYLKITIASLIFLAIAFIYFFYNKNEQLIQQIKKTHNLTLKTVDIVKTFEKMQKEEERLEKLLEIDKDFNIKTFFEQFCSQQNITPEANWEATTQEFNGSDKFDEVILPVTFKNETTQKLVTILEELNKKEIVYIKELVIKNENNGKIIFDITLATKKLKPIL